jgi:hypothetical protein
MRKTYVVLLALAVPMFGCSATVAGSPEADAEATSPSTAVVVVERTVGPDDGARVAAVARFVRMRAGAVDEYALRMVGASVELPALGECAASQSNEASAPARAVELLDIGAVFLEVAGARASLQPRRLPDIVDLVSGVVYSTRVSDADALPSRGAYVLRAAGNAELAPFVVTATAPGETAELRVAGQDARSPSGVLLDGATSTELTWDAGNADDLVYVDVSRAPSQAQSVRCLFGDTGRAALASSLFDTGDGTVTVHRLHRETFRARGIDVGEIRFDFARTVAYSRP